MLADFATIVDSLYARRRMRRKLPQRIVFIVGNGVLQVSNILNDADLRRTAKPKHTKTAEAWEAYKWRHFELARYFTATALPTFAHCCIHKLVEDGLCRDVITTNYDLYFDTIWERAPQLGVMRNPVCTSDDYLWDDYYSHRSAGNGPRYWKIHGSLSHICFRPNGSHGQAHIYSLPRFAISINDGKLAANYGIPTQAPFMGFESAMHPNTSFTPQTDLESRFSPFIDWTYNNDRSNFQKEILGAKAVLRGCRSIAAVFMLGFSGYYNDADPNDPWNEELIPELRQMRAAGFRNIFMAVHTSQFATRTSPTKRFMREMDADGRCVSYSDAGTLMDEILRRYSQRFPIRTTEYIYNRWSQWYLNEKEPTHI